MLPNMICSVNSHATPPPHTPALGTSSCFFLLGLAHVTPCLKGFLPFVQGHLLPLCQGTLPKTSLIARDPACLLVIGFSLVAKAFPYHKGCLNNKKISLDSYPSYKGLVALIARAFLSTKLPAMPLVARGGVALVARAQCCRALVARAGSPIHQKMVDSFFVKANSN